MTLFVFDVNDSSSFEILESWLEEMNTSSNKLKNWIPLQFLIGNKVDTPGTRVILTSDAKEFAQNYDMKYFETK